LGPLEELAIITEAVAGVDEVGGHVAADILEHPINITPVLGILPVWGHILV
jgi:hypothetical protein